MVEEPDAEPHRFFVVHIQKTAGTSLRDRFRNHFPTEAIYPNGSDGKALVAVISVQRLLESWAERGDQIRLIAGHFPLSTVELIDAPFTTLTVLRDPVQRTLSYLRHQRSVVPEDRATPLEQIYDDPFRFDGLIHNHMTRMYSLSVEEMREADGALARVPYTPERLELAKEGLSRIDDIGLQSHFEEYCEHLGDRYGLDLGAPKVANTTEEMDVPEHLVERIRHDNAMDVELYDFAERLYRERRTSLRA